MREPLVVQPARGSPSPRSAAHTSALAYRLGRCRQSGKGQRTSVVDQEDHVHVVASVQYEIGALHADS